MMGNALSVAGTRTPFSKSGVRAALVKTS